MLKKNMDIISFMDRAVELSRNNISCSGGPFGAVIVKNDQIIAEGCNMVTRENDPTAHAEVVAIRDACKKLKTFDLSGCEIYTSCEPCPMCLAAIYWARLDTVYFANEKHDAANIGFDDKFIYDEFALDINKRKIKMVKLDHKDALEVFNEWKNMDDKIEY